MSNALICTALGVPPDRWPPDHYALLGLGRGEADAATIEAHVLDRMERLRRYQLTHPDAVTDAMNRLAQALVCLTDPQARRAYDASLGIADPSPAPPAAADASVTTAADETIPLVPLELPAAHPVPPAPRPGQPSSQARRSLYRRRAAFRRLVVAWDGVGQLLADAQRPWNSRTDLVELVQHLAAIRLLTADDDAPLSAAEGRPGAQVIALARQPLLVTVLREVAPPQRQALAADWSAGRARLDALDGAFRQELRPDLRRAVRRRLRRLTRAAFVDHLDLSLMLIGLAALALAVYRSRW
jgi:hypothetical protein